MEHLQARGHNFSAENKTRQNIDKDHNYQSVHIMNISQLQKNPTTEPEIEPGIY